MWARATTAQQDRAAGVAVNIHILYRHAALIVASPLHLSNSLPVVSALYYS